MFASILHDAFSQHWPNTRQCLQFLQRTVIEVYGNHTGSLNGWPLLTTLLVPLLRHLIRTRRQTRDGQPSHQPAKEHKFHAQ